MTGFALCSAVCYNGRMKKTLTFTVRVFREGRQYVSFNPELRVASCGKTPLEARQALGRAMGAFIRAAKEMGTLDEILEEAGFVKARNIWRETSPVSVARMSMVV